MKTHGFAGYVAGFCTFAVATTAFAGAGWDTGWQKPLAFPSSSTLTTINENQYQPTEVAWISPVNDGSPNGTPMVAMLWEGAWSQRSLGGLLENIVTAPLAGWNYEWAVGSNEAGEVFVIGGGGGEWDSTWTDTGGVTAWDVAPALAATTHGPRIFAIGTDNNPWVDISWAPEQPWLGWTRLPALPSLPGAVPFHIYAVTRGGNNYVALPANPYIDVVVTTNEGTIYHMEYDTGTGQGSWENVPTPYGYAAYDGVELTSSDLNTVEIVENLAWATIALYESSSPGWWTSLPVPQGLTNCGEDWMGLTSPTPGELRFWAMNVDTPVYSDLYEADPTTSGTAFCR